MLLNKLTNMVAKSKAAATAACSTGDSKCISRIQRKQDTSSDSPDERQTSTLAAKKASIMGARAMARRSVLLGNNKSTSAGLKDRSTALSSQQVPSLKEPAHESSTLRLSASRSSSESPPEVTQLVERGIACRDYIAEPIDSEMEELHDWMETQEEERRRRRCVRREQWANTRQIIQEIDALGQHDTCEKQSEDCETAGERDRRFPAAKSDVIESSKIAPSTGLEAEQDDEFGVFDCNFKIEFVDDERGEGSTALATIDAWSREVNTTLEDQEDSGMDACSAPKTLGKAADSPGLQETHKMLSPRSPDAALGTSSDFDWDNLPAIFELEQDDREAEGGDSLKSGPILPGKCVVEERRSAVADLADLDSFLTDDAELEALIRQHTVAE